MRDTFIDSKGLFECLILFDQTITIKEHRLIFEVLGIDYSGFIMSWSCYRAIVNLISRCL